MSIGENINRYRQGNGMSITDLSDASGISRGYLSELINGRAKEPSVSVLQAIAKGLGASVADVIDGQPSAHVWTCRHWNVQWGGQPGGSLKCTTCGKQWTCTEAQS